MDEPDAAAPESAHPDAIAALQEKYGLPSLTPPEDASGW